MAKYAISPEGAAAMKSLAQSLMMSANGIMEASTALFQKTTALSDGLGLYETEILQIINKNKTALVSNKDAIVSLANAAKQMSENIESLFMFSSDGSSGTGASSGSSNPSGGQEYDAAGSGADSGGYSRHFSSEEANAQYQRAVEFVDEMIQNYRTELVGHGAMDGAMLTKFLAKQRSDMLQYEAEEINVAQGLRAPLSDEERYHYVIVGENSPYGYDNLMNEFGQFCMSDIRSWVSTINPNPNNDPRRHMNCGKCAAAVFERLNGNNDAVAGLGTYSISEMNSITGRIQTPMSPSDIENYLHTQGAGAHVVVGVDRANGAGHWFNAFYDGHQVYTIEGQGGEINGWPPDYGNVVYWDASI